MINYKIWNKIDDINGCNAKTVIEDMKIKESDEIILIYDDISNRVSEIQFKDILRSIYEISEEDANIVGQRYLEIKQKEKLQAKKEQITLEQQQEKISILDAENEKLKEGLQAVLRGDMQSLAYILYQEDFNNQATIEL